MEFNLLLTNQHRVRWLLRSLLAYAAGVIGLLVLHTKFSFWGVMALPITLLILLLFWDKLFRQPVSVLLEADGLAWADPATDLPCRVLLAEITAYRFATSRNGIALRLCLRSGELVRLEGSFNDEFVVLHKAFDQAVKRYNQTYPDAAIGREKDGFEKFFTRPLSTKVLLRLLAAGVAWGAWCLGHHAAAAAYLPLGLLLPYLLVWANFYYERA